LSREGVYWTYENISSLKEWCTDETHFHRKMLIRQHWMVSRRHWKRREWYGQTFLQIKSAKSQVVASCLD